MLLQTTVFAVPPIKVKLGAFPFQVLVLPHYFSVIGTKKFLLAAG